jgi:hypothetical protein
LVPWIDKKFATAEKIPRSAAAYPFPFAPGRPLLVSVRITSISLAMAAISCDCKSP